jgi:hypothetical protein
LIQSFFDPEPLIPSFFGPSTPEYHFQEPHIRTHSLHDSVPGHRSVFAQTPSEELPNQAVQTAEFNKQLEQQRKNRNWYYLNDYWARPHEPTTPVGGPKTTEALHTLSPPPPPVPAFSSLYLPSRNPSPSWNQSPEYTDLRAQTGSIAPPRPTSRISREPRKSNLLSLLNDNDGTPPLPTPRVDSRPQSASLADRPFKCGQCPEAFDRLNDLRRHKRIHLPRSSNRTSTTDEAVAKEQFFKRTAWANPQHPAHQQLHYDVLGSSSVRTGNEPYTARFEINDKTGDQGICPVPECGVIFTDLKAHMLTHHREQLEKPLKCDQCPQSFNRGYDLERHKRTHLAATSLASPINDTEPEEPRRRKPIEQNAPPSPITEQEPGGPRASCDICIRESRVCNKSYPSCYQCRIAGVNCSYSFFGTNRAPSIGHDLAPPPPLPLPRVLASESRGNMLSANSRPTPGLQSLPQGPARSTVDSVGRSSIAITQQQHLGARKKLYEDPEIFISRPTI